MKSKELLVASLVSAFVILMVSGAAYAANCNASITASSLPCTIAAPGNFVLTGYVSKSFTTPAITINASNVVLDLNGYTIVNTNGANSTDGITTAASPSNVTVRNGKIYGFFQGINFPQGSGIIVDNMNIDALNTGIDVEASNSIIRNNVTKSGSRGIIICEADVRVLNNEIISDGGGIDSCDGSTIRTFVEGNRITNPTANGGNGIYLRNQGALIVNNRFNNWSVGIQGSDTEPMKYRDNLFISVTTNVMGAAVIDAGNNN